MNTYLYNIQLRLAKELDRYWDFPQTCISESRNKTLEQIYKKNLIKNGMLSKIQNKETVQHIM